MPNNGQNRLLTTSEVAQMLHLHINTVRRWSNNGILKPYHIGMRGDRRFLLEDVINFLTMQKYESTVSDKQKDGSDTRK